VAKFSDYKHLIEEQIEGEIDEAQARTVERAETEDHIPERFRGKSKEDVIQSFVELESLSGRHSQELGELRRTVASLTEAQKKALEKPPQEIVPVTLDDLYANTDASVRRVAKEESSAVSSRIDELEQKLTQSEQRAAIAEARARFEGKHPNYKDTIADADFTAWLKASPVRVALAQAADQGNFEAADELFSTYGEIKQLKTARPAARTSEARRVGLERSGGASTTPEKTFSKSELQEKRMAAQRGDRAAARWLTANNDEITTAYAEGRLTA
jgi:hypothetical protein